MSQVFLSSLYSLTQGRTRKLFLHDVSDRVVIVDAPGYGYKHLPKNLDWLQLVKDYIKRSRRLALVVTLINSQHGVMETDREWLSFLNNAKMPVLPLISKCDKVHSPEEVCAAIWKDTRQCKACLPYVLGSSSKSQLGLEELRAIIVERALSAKLR